MIYSRLPPNAPSPRICIVRKKEEHMEYGFNLHAERGKGQFVGAVDAGSPAEQAGLRLGDRIFAVNGELIAGSTHKEVVRRIKSNPLRCELLVISEEGARLYAKHGILIDHSLPNIVQKFEMDSDRESNTHQHHYEANFHEQGEEQQEEPPIPFSSSSSSLSATSVNSNNCHSNLHHLYWSNNNTATSKFLSNASAPRTQIAYPPPTAATATFAGMMAALRPRLCRLIKHSPADEFGFNLHAERGKGHFIGAVDKNGIADRAGLETGQRIVGVNGQLIFPNTAHKEVVALIKRDPLTTELLVASEEVDRWHSENSASFSYDSVIVYEPLLPSSSSSASPAICSGHNHHHTPSTNHQRNGSYEGASGRAIRSRVGSSSSAKIESEAERLHNNDYQNIQNNVSLSSVDTFGRPQQLVTTTFTKDNWKSTNHEKRDSDSSRSFPIITVDANNATSIRLDSIDICDDNDIHGRKDQSFQQAPNSCNNTTLTNHDVSYWDSVEPACVEDASIDRMISPISLLTTKPTYEAGDAIVVNAETVNGRLVYAKILNEKKKEKAISTACTLNRVEETDLLLSQLQLEHLLEGEAVEEEQTKRKGSVKSRNVDDRLKISSRNGDAALCIRETDISSSSIVCQRESGDVPFSPSTNDERRVKHVIASGGAVISNNNQCTAVSNLRPGSFDSGVVPLSAKPVPLMVPPPSKGNNPSSASVFKDENLNNTSYYSNGSNGNVMENNGGGYSVGAAGTSPIGYGNIDDGLKSSDIFKLNAKEARQAMRHRKRDPRQSNNMSLEEKYKVIANL